jgi:tetratricopeptide (TPR) repeat protein
MRISIRAGYSKRLVENGMDLADKGKFNESIAAATEAIKLDPTFANPWNVKGVALYGLGKYNESIKAYNNAIQLDPNFSLA